LEEKNHKLHQTPNYLIQFC